MANQPDQEDREPKDRRICSSCVGEPFLKSKIEKTGEESECFYCAAEGNTFSIEDLATKIESAFDRHFERTATDPDGYGLALIREGYDWERSGDEVLWAIAGAAEIDEDPARDVLSVLEDRHYDHDLAQTGEEYPFAVSSHYLQKELGCDEFAEKWDGFERGLKTEARFFSRSAQAMLDELFADLSTLSTDKGKRVVVTAGPSTAIPSLHRARVFAAEDEKLIEALKDPGRHLGTPPMIAAAAGRMNARGITVFYGAVEADTALAEVRPPVGSKVAVAKFAIIRPLRLLDVEALKVLNATGSIFDPQYAQHLQRANFLGILSRRITRPVMPNEEDFEYIATQAVADYLATEANLDGIIFPSVQDGGNLSNVVLFHHSARVEDVRLPKDAELEVSLTWRDEEGESPDYMVYEKVSGPVKVKRKGPSLINWPLLSFEPPDIRIPSLKVDLKNVTIHHITAVTFSKRSYPVGHHRIKL